MNAIASVQTKPVHYPEDNGEPMSENTLQFQWIQTIEGGLEAVFRDDPNVFVAGNLLWYPVEGNNVIRAAPDALVAFGRPKKGRRGSYLQWLEGNVPPQVVFEVASPGNRPGQLSTKLKFYETYGVEEYYFYDPDDGELKGWIRDKNQLIPVPEMRGWRSPRLKVRFDVDGCDLILVGPDGKKFATYVESIQQRDIAIEEKEQALREKERLQQRAERLAEKLKSLGIDPEG